jgi:hypothetical protein
MNNLIILFDFVQSELDIAIFVSVQSDFEVMQIQFPREANVNFKLLNFISEKL